MCGTIVSLKPGHEDLRHLHQVNRTRRSIHETFDCMDDHPRVERGRILDGLHDDQLAREQNAQLKGTCLFTFKFASKGLCSRHNALDALCNARPKRQVEGPGLSSTMEPGHDFVPAEQAKLLLEFKLGTKKINNRVGSRDTAPTSGSVKPRPIAIKLGTRIPSWNTDPMNRCRLGVNLNGTTSLDAKIGA